MIGRFSVVSSDAWRNVPVGWPNKHLILSRPKDSEEVVVGAWAYMLSDSKLHRASQVTALMMIGPFPYKLLLDMKPEGLVNRVLELITSTLYTSPIFWNNFHHWHYKLFTSRPTTSTHLGTPSRGHLVRTRDGKVEAMRLTWTQCQIDCSDSKSKS